MTRNRRPARSLRPPAKTPKLLLHPWKSLKIGQFPAPAPVSKSAQKLRPHPHSLPRAVRRRPGGVADVAEVVDAEVEDVSKPWLKLLPLPG
ncbi:MAG: hypothetical protein WAM04_06535 [Candidatus Sulfotelmatobacter sp.]